MTHRHDVECSLHGICDDGLVVGEQAQVNATLHYKYDLEMLVL